MPDPIAPATGRLAALLGYLAEDRTNLALIAEAAETALSEGQLGVARELLARYASHAPLPPQQQGQLGLVAMRQGEFQEASDTFEKLLEESPSDPALRFNRAWALAMLKAFEPALALLDPATNEALPQAAMLHVQLLHDRGEFEAAMAAAKAHLVRHPSHPGLLAAVSVLAIDMEDVELARTCALQASGHPDATITLGALALGEERSREALALFLSALEVGPEAPRGWVGKGLAEIAIGSRAEGARSLQHGAELFGEHVGSWIAAGWAHLVNSNAQQARACFDTALALDHNFSESHGSLAALNVMEGRTEEARRQTQTALRLDPKSFSGALAQALLLSAAGKPDVARQVVQRALNTPIDSSGRTLASVIARQALSS